MFHIPHIPVRPQTSIHRPIKVFKKALYIMICYHVAECMIGELEERFLQHFIIEIASGIVLKTIINQLSQVIIKTWRKIYVHHTAKISEKRF